MSTDGQDALPRDRLHRRRSANDDGGDRRGHPDMPTASRGNHWPVPADSGADSRLAVMRALEPAVFTRWGARREIAVTREVPAPRETIFGFLALVRRGKGGRRREVGMDAWGWEELRPWLELRVQLPVGPLFCVINRPTRGRPWSSAAARADLRRTALAARRQPARRPTPAPARSCR